MNLLWQFHEIGFTKYFKFLYVISLYPNLFHIRKTVNINDLTEETDTKDRIKIHKLKKGNRQMNCKYVGKQKPPRHSRKRKKKSTEN